MVNDELDEFSASMQKPRRSRAWLTAQAVVFLLLLAVSFVGIWYVYQNVQAGQTQTILLLLFSLNGIAATVNMYRTFRPHKT